MPFPNPKLRLRVEEEEEEEERERRRRKRKKKNRNRRSSAIILDVKESSFIVKGGVNRSIRPSCTHPGSVLFHRTNCSNVVSFVVACGGC